MFTSFIYTECISPGPFKKESGFKFKSVESHSAEDALAQEDVLNRAASKFPNFTAPKIDSFMKPEDFLKLDKSWSYQDVGDGKYMFCRQFTSGVSNGRPDNPFHQGFLISSNQFALAVENAETLAEFAFARPADFFTWADWQNPRGDAQLEEAELEADNPPIPSLSSAAWLRTMQRLLEDDPEVSGLNLRSFEEALASSSPAKFAAKNSENFLEWVSFTTHLIPLQQAWRSQFLSHVQVTFSHKPGSAPSFIFAEPEQARMTDGHWANLASFIVESGTHESIDRQIGKLSGALEFADNALANCLGMLPLACLFLNREVIAPEDFEILVQLTNAALAEYPSHATWRSSQAMSTTLDLLESSGTVMQALPNSDYVYGLLANLMINE